MNEDIHESQRLDDFVEASGAAAGEAKSQFGTVIWLLGVLIALPSLISIIQRQFAIGLGPAFEGMVQFYRGKVAEIATAIGFFEWPLIGDLSPERAAQILDTLPSIFLLCGLLGRIEYARLDTGYEKLHVLIWRSALWFFIPLVALLALAVWAELQTTDLLPVFPMVFGIFAIMTLLGGLAKLALLLRLTDSDYAHAAASVFWRRGSPIILTGLVWCAGIVAFYVGNLITK